MFQFYFNFSVCSDVFTFWSYDLSLCITTIFWAIWNIYSIRDWRIIQSYDLGCNFNSYGCNRKCLGIREKLYWVIIYLKYYVDQYPKRLCKDAVYYWKYYLSINLPESWFGSSFNDALFAPKIMAELWIRDFLHISPLKNCGGEFELSFFWT